MMDPVPQDGRGPDGRIVAACEGFALADLRYSPGGDVLPNKCAPFHPWTNNPYAVRCVDVMPDYMTKYAGDDYCILPPPPELGVQVGVHPQQEQYWDEMWAGDFTGYEDASATAPYELAAGNETLANYDTTLVLSEDRHFYRINFRGRYGSHHSVSRFTGSPPATQEGWVARNDLFNGLGVPLANLQRANVDIPPGSLDIPPEEQGVGFPAPADTSLSFQLHHFNSTDGAILRELWLNVWWIPENEVEREAKETFGYVNVSYPPNQISDAGGTLTATGDTQLLSMFGHRHAWTTRFHAWLVRSGSSEEQLLYDSHDWLDVPTFAYNSVTQNPTPNPEQRVDGGHSGILMLKSGDRLEFNCHAEVTQERAAEIGAPLPTAPLRFANEAFTGEMCVLGTVSTGADLSLL